MMFQNSFVELQFNNLQATCGVINGERINVDCVKSEPMTDMCNDDNPFATVFIKEEPFDEGELMKQDRLIELQPFHRDPLEICSSGSVTMKQEMDERHQNTILQSSDGSVEQPKRNKPGRPKGSRENRCFCSLCCMVFDNAATLKFHVLMKHGNGSISERLLSSNNNDSGSDYVSGQRENEKSLKCVLCSYRFRSLEKLANHTCLKLKGTFCHLCQKLFPSKKLLTFHANTNCAMSALQLECDVCHEVFADETSCFYHIRDLHSSKRFICEICGAVRRSRVGLIIHLKYHDEKKRKFICTLCQKSFYDRTALKEHVVTHMSKKPYVCHICGIALSRPSRLRVHLREHSFKSSTNVQTCRRCIGCGLVRLLSSPFDPHHCLNSSQSPDEKSVARSSDVPVKVERDDDNSYRSESFDFETTFPHQWQTRTFSVLYMCEFCGNSFGQQQELEDHQKYVHPNTDPNSLPFTCDNCVASFESYSRLATHRLSHGINLLSYTVPNSSMAANVNESQFVIPRYFSCRLCRRTYSQYTVFTNHVKFGKHRSNKKQARGTEVSRSAETDDRKNER